MDNEKLKLLVYQNVEETGCKIVDDPILAYTSNTCVLYEDLACNVPQTFSVRYHSNRPNETGETIVEVSGYTQDDNVIVEDNTFEIPYGIGSLSNQNESGFSRWNTKEDGSGTDYSTGATFTITSNIDLYAIWEYYIYYESNDNSPVTCPYGSPFFNGVNQITGYSTSIITGNEGKFTIDILLPTVLATPSPSTQVNIFTGNLQKIITSEFVVGVVNSFQYLSNLTTIGFENVTYSEPFSYNSTRNITRVDVDSLEEWCRIQFKRSNTTTPFWYTSPTKTTNLYVNNQILNSNLVIPSSITQIGNYTFYGFNNGIITSVTIHNNITSIGAFSFSHCGGLSSVDFGAGITSIGEKAFEYCDLRDIVIPESLTAMTNEYKGAIFSYNPQLSSITVDSNNTVYDSRNNCNAIIETSSNTLIEGSNITIIPNSVTSIGNYAFMGRINLTSITIPNSVTSIGNSAFSGCSGLTSIEIPNSVTNIGSAAFSVCRSLTSVTIPNSVTSIGDWAFSYCISLTSITIPNSVTSIGSNAFTNCSSLTSIVVENGNSVYDSRNNCNAIIEMATNTLIVGCKNTTIPNSVTSIGDWAFRDCTNLTGVTIPNSVTSIGEYAFYGCAGLNIMNCYATTPPLCGGSYTFQGVNKSIPVYVPAASVSAYQTADVWKDFNNIQPMTT